jgi:hypothetical protein
VGGLAVGSQSRPAFAVKLSAFCRDVLLMQTAPLFSVVKVFAAHAGLHSAIVRFPSTAELQKVMEAKAASLTESSTVSIDYNRPRAERADRAAQRAAQRQNQLVQSAAGISNPFVLNVHAAVFVPAGASVAGR